MLANLTCPRLAKLFMPVTPRPFEGGDVLRAVMMSEEHQLSVPAVKESVMQQPACTLL